MDVFFAVEVAASPFTAVLDAVFTSVFGAVFGVDFAGAAFVDFAGAAFAVCAGFLAVFSVVASVLVVIVFVGVAFLFAALTSAVFVSAACDDVDAFAVTGASVPDFVFFAREVKAFATAIMREPAFAGAASVGVFTSLAAAAVALLLVAMRSPFVSRTPILLVPNRALAQLSAVFGQY